MTKPKRRAGNSAGPVVTIEAEKNETEPETMARVMVTPFLRHGCLGQAVITKAFGDLPNAPGFDDLGKAIKVKAEAAANGDLTLATEMLVAQAISLDALFAELARRATVNLGDYPQAAERYARLAFKAQSNSRAAIEALAKLHQPREQIVRHVHVNEGGQAVIADQFHNHAGGPEFGQSVEQPHATGAGPAGASPALPCPDPLGPAVPIPGSEGQAPVPNARRQGKRCA